MEIKQGYIDFIKKKDKNGGNSEWTELVGELTDYLNANRGKYGPWTYAVIAKKVAYIKSGGGIGELRFFMEKVKEKGGWFFWWTVSPKNRT